MGSVQVKSVCGHNGVSVYSECSNHPPTAITVSTPVVMVFWTMVAAFGGCGHWGDFANTYSPAIFRGRRPCGSFSIAFFLSYSSFLAVSNNPRMLLAGLYVSFEGRTKERRRNDLIFVKGLVEWPRSERKRKSVFNWTFLFRLYRMIQGAPASACKYVRFAFSPVVGWRNEKTENSAKNPMDVL